MRRGRKQRAKGGRFHHCAQNQEARTHLIFVPLHDEPHTPSPSLSSLLETYLVERMTAMGPFQRNHLFNNPDHHQHRHRHPVCSDHRHHRQQQQRHEQQHDGSVIFTHLFSAPLIERKMATGGSGCALVEKVDELSYQKERDTLHSTLDNAGKRVRFLSEAANTTSFARAVGCRPARAGCRAGGGAAEAEVGAAGVAGASGGGSCRDGECRIVHFTGHGVEGQLTFEDNCGRLQYVDEEQLLNMLSCGRRSSPATVYPPAAGAAAAAAGFGGGIGYAPYVDEAAEPEFRLEDLGLGVGGRKAGRAGGDDAGAPRTGLQLVFLSSCHSQSVAKCFIEAVSLVFCALATCTSRDIYMHMMRSFFRFFLCFLVGGERTPRRFMGLVCCVCCVFYSSLVPGRQHAGAGKCSVWFEYGPTLGNL